MQNVGSVFRTCDAFAIQELILCGYTPTPPHRDIQKTALGATETVVWRHFDSVSDAIAIAKEQGFKVAAVEQATNSSLLQEFEGYKGGLALVLGNEVSGVSDDVLSLADYCIEIPQFGAKHSLNVSVAAGIVLWDLVRRIAF
jgi:tRNA G18 (ribose-2'-O)-methylase SpoU